MTEDIIDALLARMEERLPELLDEVWAEKAGADAVRDDAIPLVYPEKYLFGRRSTDLLAFPSVLLWDESTAFENGSTSNAGTESASGWSLAEHTLICAVLIQSDDEGILDRMVARYRAAMFRFFRESAVLPGVPYFELDPIRVGRDSRAAGLRISSPGVRGLLWDLIARAEENF